MRDPAPASGRSPRAGPWWGRYVLPLQLVGLNLLLLGLARAALYILYQDDFAHFTTAEVLGKFARGARFDLSVTLAAYGVPLLMLSLPFRFAAQRLWRLGWGWVCYALFLGFLLLSSSDLVYYDFVRRHVGPEVTTLTEEGGDLWRLALGDHAAELAALALTAALLFLLWRRLLRPRAIAAPGGSRWTLAAGVVAPLLLLYTGVRGSPSGDSLTAADAFQSDGPLGAQLVLNGPVTVLHSLVFSRGAPDYFPWSEATETVTGMIVAPGETRPRPDEYPIYRVPAAREEDRGTPLNVVVVLLEGWSLDSVDCYRERLGLEPLGATPNLDAVAREGLLLDRLYACGQRTRNGYGAVLAGVPNIPGVPYFGRGLEQRGLTYLGHLAREHGYGTYFVMGARRDGQNRETHLAVAGFDHLAGAEDMPEESIRTPDGKQRALDHFTLLKAHEMIAAAEEPFLCVIHTDSTHEPYTRTRARGWKPFRGEDRHSRYMTALAYADWSLGQFLAKARGADYFDRTAFVILSDHIQRKPQGKPEPPELFHIPGIVMAPGVEPGVHERVSGQADVIATVADLAGWRAPHATFGRSVLGDADAPPRGVLCGMPGLLVWVEDEGWIAHNGEARIASGTWAPAADLDAIEHRMLCYYQFSSRLLLEDRVAPPPRRRQ